MPQLVEGFFLASFEKEPGVFRQAVKPLIQPIGGEESRRSAQLRFPENECQDGDEKIHVRDPQHLRGRIGRSRDELSQQCRGMVLLSERVIGCFHLNRVVPNSARDRRALGEGERQEFEDRGVHASHRDKFDEYPRHRCFLSVPQEALRFKSYLLILL